MSFMSNAVSAGMAVKSKDHWHDLEQAMINESWNNSTQIAEGLKEQRRIGSIIDPTYIDPTGTSEESKQAMLDVEAWHAPVLEITGVNYYKTEDQATQFIFRNIDKENINGKYYYWDNNYWLSFYEYDKTTYQSYCVCVRCDNELKYKDPKDGQTYSWPCRINNEATASKYKETDYLITPSNNYIAIVQRNSDTERLFRLNRRFLIGGGGDNDNLRPFKINGIQNSHKDYKLNSSGEHASNLLYITLTLDEVQDKDDFVNGIAWNADSKYIPDDEYIIEPKYDSLRYQVPKTFEITKACGYSQPDFVIDSIVYPGGEEHVSVVRDPSNEYKFTVTSKVILPEQQVFYINAHRRSDLAGLPQGTIYVYFRSKIG